LVSEELVSIAHVVYGLRLAANLTIPGVAVQLDSNAFNVPIWFREWKTFPSECLQYIDPFRPSSDPDNLPNLRVGVLRGGDHLVFCYRDGVRFVVERQGREVWCDWRENYTLEDACTYLLGPVLGFVLRLRGVVCLHASAVAVGDRAIALVGLPGAGKSTAAAAFACAGYPVISDDVVALEDHGERFLVQPGYPRVNLWPDSVRRLFASEDALPRITPTWEKRYLPLDRNGHHFASKPLPLAAVYILDSRDPALTAPAMERVSGKEAFMALLANTYVNYLLDQNMRRTEFDVLGRVVAEIPIRRVRSPDEPSAIFGLCEAIAADARRGMATAPENPTPVAG